MEIITRKEAEKNGYILLGFYHKSDYKEKVEYVKSLGFEIAVVLHSDYAETDYYDLYSCKECIPYFRLYEVRLELERNHRDIDTYAHKINRIQSRNMELMKIISECTMEIKKYVGRKNNRRKGRGIIQKLIGEWGKIPWSKYWRCIRKKRNKNIGSRLS